MGTNKDGEESLRATHGLARLMRRFQETHREALEWLGEAGVSNLPKGGGGTPVGPGYVKALARALVTSGVIQDAGRAEVFAEKLAGQFEYKYRAQGVEVPSIERVIRTIRCMFYGVPNTRGCEQPSSIVDAVRRVINATHYYGDFIRYIAREKFGREPSDVLVQRAEYYLYRLDEWVRRQGIGKGGITDYPAMSMVAATALAIADVEAGDPRSAIEALGRGDTRVIITRLRLGDFINWLGES
jgi:hypothetical protein